MNKVFEWLNSNMFYDKSLVRCEEKPNGHYFVLGTWAYPLERRRLTQEDYDRWRLCSNEEMRLHACDLPEYIEVLINNETIIVGNIYVKNMENLYHYLQTYEHIPRGEADENGYYARSTGEEIIRYLETYLNAIKK